MGTTLTDTVSCFLCQHLEPATASNIFWGAALTDRISRDPGDRTDRISRGPGDRADGIDVPVYMTRQFTFVLILMDGSSAGESTY